MCRKRDLPFSPSRSWWIRQLELVKKANAVLASRRLDEEVLEKYRQKAKTRFEQEESYKEELEQDEIGSVIYLGRRART